MRFLSLVSCFLLSLGASQIFAQQYVENDSMKVQLSSEKDDPMRFKLSESEATTQETAPQKKDVRCSFLMLSNLAKAAESIEQTRAFDCLDSMLGYFQSSPAFNEDGFKNAIEIRDGSTATCLLKIRQENSVFL
jgi:hypothetical protein